MNKWLVLMLLADAPSIPAGDRLVDATTVVPSLQLDLRYATPDNFLHRAVYPEGSRCLLLKDSADKLAVATKALEPKGFRLSVFDCFRPRSVQYEMWKILPKPGYVADPRSGSNHNKGGAVDLTMVQLDGGVVEMPTPFDTFSKAAHHGYQGGTTVSRRNRETLREAMEGAGFKRNPMEWWHYDVPNAGKLPLLEASLVADAGS